MKTNRNPKQLTQLDKKKKTDLQDLLAINDTQESNDSSARTPPMPSQLRYPLILNPPTARTARRQRQRSPHISPDVAGFAPLPAAAPAAPAPAVPPPPSSLMAAIGANPSIARALSKTKFLGMAARIADLMGVKDRPGVPAPPPLPPSIPIDMNDALREASCIEASPAWQQRVVGRVGGHQRMIGTYSMIYIREFVEFMPECV